MNFTRPSLPFATAALALSILIAGCNSRESSPPQDKAPHPARLADVPAGDADLLQNVPVGKTGPLSEADKVWEEILLAMQPPAAPPEWETNAPSEEALGAFRRKQGALAGEAAAKAGAFRAKYPKHDKSAEAGEMERRLLSIAAQLGQTNAVQRLLELDEARLKDPNLTEDERLQVKVEQLQRAVQIISDTNVAAVVSQLEKGVRALQKEFTNRHEISGLLLGVAESWLDAGKPDNARTVAQEVADTSKEPEVQDAAQGMLRKLARLGQPFELKFKAVDGREVDLQSMKGKVVLVDFWATWCTPCMAELPKVKAAYTKLQTKGFEIVGISFDSQKDVLERVIAAEKMTWPQHFDDTPGGNRFGDQFQVASIPTMWLVDKKGNLRELNARDNLVEKVEKLLAE